MAITKYSELKAAIGDWLDRSEYLDRVPDFVALAIATLNKVLRDRRMIVTATVTFAAGARNADTPVDMIDPVFISNSTDDHATLEERTIEDLAALRQRRMTAQGKPRFYSIVGAKLEVCPTPNASTVLEVAYYQEIPALAGEDDTNWLLTHHPDVLLYAALLHASTFLKDDMRVQLFGSLVAQQITAAVQTQDKVSLGQ